MVGRLAPSPTGLLHVGNARSLLLAWLSARAVGGRIFLRIEDLLPGEDHVDALVADLRWLGLDWDEAPLLAGAWDPAWGARSVRQSGRSGVYEGVLRAMERAGLAYPCVCTRKDIEAAATAPHAEDQGTPYPGLCRGAFDAEEDALAVEASRAQAAGRAALGVAWRLRVPDGVVTFEDRLRGARTVSLPHHSGDIVVRRKDGGFAYMLAAVVDDVAMGVTEVVRGDDLLDATAQQLAVYGALRDVAARRGGGGRRSQEDPELEALWERAATWEPPAWVHVPLVFGDDGRRLAKRNRSLHVAALREAGVQAERLRLWLARSVGLDSPHLPELVAAFDWRRVPREAVTFGAAELATLARGAV